MCNSDKRTSAFAFNLQHNQYYVVDAVKRSQLPHRKKQKEDSRVDGKPNRRQMGILYRLVIIQTNKKLKIDKPDSTAMLPHQAFIIF